MKTLILLPIVLAGLLSTVHLLPDGGDMATSAVSMELPQGIGSWQMRTIPATADEISVLADDTSFAKAICLSPRPGEYDLATGHSIPDRIDLSIVLSGHDINNSIHRPERCMPAQGHLISETEDFEIELKNGRKFEVRRLLSVQSMPTNKERTEYVSYNCITYYFFVGHNQITQDHLKRTLLDMKDRLVHGMDQRWAYVSASMWYGKIPWIEEELTYEEADAKLREFLANLTDEQIDWNMIAP